MNNKKLIALALIAIASASSVASAQKKYDPGATDTEIKIGQTIPYSGPGSSFSTIGKAEAAYFRMVNDRGGVNGRKIVFVSLDDGYSPPKTVEQTRKLVEQDEVLLIFQGLGTPNQQAVRRYMNGKRVPQLFVASGSTIWADPEHFPWTMGWQPNYQVEGKIYAKYLLETNPNAKVAVLYQNDDTGKGYVAALKAGLGTKAETMIVKELSYELTEPTIDSQIATLKSSGADTFFDAASPRFAAQAIRKAADIGWQPLHFLISISSSPVTVLQPAGLDKSVGIISAAYLKDPADKRWVNDKDFQDWLAWMKKYYPDGNVADLFNAYGYAAAYTMVQVLKQCGDDLTRENVMKQAANIEKQVVPMLLPGIELSTSPTNFSPLRQMRLQKFDGTTWVLFTDAMQE